MVNEPNMNNNRKWTQYQYKTKILFNAVFHRPDWGPCFGDLMVRDLSNTHRNNSMEPEGFESPNGHALYSDGGKIFMGGEDGSFQTLEIEVFLVL